MRDFDWLGECIAHPAQWCNPRASRDAGHRVPKRRPRLSGAFICRRYNRSSLFFVRVRVPALLLVLVALLLLLLLLLLVAHTILIALVLGTLVLSHGCLRMPRTECRGRVHSVQRQVNVVWQFSYEIVKRRRTGRWNRVDTAQPRIHDLQSRKRNELMTGAREDAVSRMNTAGARRFRPCAAQKVLKKTKFLAERAWTILIELARSGRIPAA